MQIRAALFDLDNCLAAANEPGEALFAPAFDAMRAHGELSPAAMADCWVHALDVVARKHGFSDEMLAAGWRAFRAIEVKQPLHGYGDLAEIADLPVARILVTSGFRRLQESKIAALGVGPVFDEIHVDAIDEAPRRSKQAIFADILLRRGWTAGEVLVVGDNAESEIAAGNALGMPTVQVLRPGVVPTTEARFRIRTLRELSKLIRR